jgi:hypothetical protein
MDSCREKGLAHVAMWPCGDGRRLNISLWQPRTLPDDMANYTANHQATWPASSGSAVPLHAKSPSANPPGSATGLMTSHAFHQLTRSAGSATPTRQHICSKSAWNRGSLLCRCSPSVISFISSSRGMPA